MLGMFFSFNAAPPGDVIFARSIVRGAPYALLAVIFIPAFLFFFADTVDFARFLPNASRWSDRSKIVLVLTPIGLWLGYPILMLLMSGGLRTVQLSAEVAAYLCGLSLWFVLTVVWLFVFGVLSDLSSQRELDRQAMQSDQERVIRGGQGESLR